MRVRFGLLALITVTFVVSIGGALSSIGYRTDIITVEPVANFATIVVNTRYKWGFPFTIKLSESTILFIDQKIPSELVDKRMPERKTFDESSYRSLFPEYPLDSDIVNHHEYVVPKILDAGEWIYINLLLDIAIYLLIGALLAIAFGKIFYNGIR